MQVGRRWWAGQPFNSQPCVTPKQPYCNRISMDPPSRVLIATHPYLKSLLSTRMRCINGGLARSQSTFLNMVSKTRWSRAARKVVEALAPPMGPLRNKGRVPCKRSQRTLTMLSRLIQKRVRVLVENLLSKVLLLLAWELVGPGGPPFQTLKSFAYSTRPSTWSFKKGRSNWEMTSSS
jgi:hypothetical protein